MKISYLLSFLLALTVISVSGQQTGIEKQAVMIENQSSFGFTETMEVLSKTIAEKGWKITTIHDLQETMKKNGKEVLPVKVIELCNPAHAFGILSKDEYRDVSPMLPCRISVYEKSDGNTYVSRMNAPAFAAMIGGDAAATMVKAYNETEEMLRLVIQ
ncbi:uncharacterized conserved protein, DUF302 family [Lentimicrobium saccharophilum]|uniref:Uncharacterized conserved protein, DUF302 family n=1 Tax=Lentimicrobium saccharophilum TaxID=1678841 RepID=A0A0S7C3V8_9BACT|nr:DUF302 domain-containing protein [Lentimicrobium saccharophilum]GAP43888.1 uncharacterized conserved protein, DUF302 family [Lentimicrobium saccharophilum]